LRDRWLATIPGLSGHALQVSYARSELYAAELGEVAHALNELCQLAEQAQPAARDALAAFVPVIADSTHLSRVWSVRATALAAGLPAAMRLLRCSTPEGHLLDQTKQAHGIPQRADGQPLTLGERRALARKPTRATLDKLLRDPHPLVVRLLLGNPRITETDIVHMAARRPAIPAVAVEIAKAWTRVPRVRMAIALNPGSPPAVSVPMLGLMMRPELGEVVRAADLPAVVRATARELYQLRPPLAQLDPSAIKH
jgi:hypothetical protein